MFFLGHLGIGKTMAKPWSASLPLFWILVGCVLPDLIDKPLYYGLSWYTGLRGQDLGLISGTRTFGHTGILWALLVASGFISKKARSVALGLSTHLILDFTTDALDGHLWDSSCALAFVFPALGVRFPVSPFDNLENHLSVLMHRASIIGGEIAGAYLLWRRPRSR